VLGGAIDTIEELRANDGLERAGTFLDLACGSGMRLLDDRMSCLTNQGEMQYLWLYVDGILTILTIKKLK
jgi:hypothetical protein